MLTALQLRENFAHSFEIPCLTADEFAAQLRQQRTVSLSTEQVHALQSAFPAHGVPIKRLLGALDAAGFCPSPAEAAEIIRKCFRAE